MDQIVLIGTYLAMQKFRQPNCHAQANLRNLVPTILMQTQVPVRDENYEAPLARRFSPISIAHVQCLG